MKSRESLLFWILGLIWGTSFLWIKIAVQDVTPSVMVAFRASIATLGLIPMIIFNRKIRFSWSDFRNHWLHFIFMGFFNIAFPFMMIGWASQFLDSGLTSLINSTTPLSTIAISCFFLKDDRATVPKVVGLLTGFTGVVLLMLPNIQSGLSQNLLAQGAILIAAVSYSVAAVFARRKLHDQAPEIQAIAQVTTSSIMMWMYILLVENPIRLPQKPITWLALFWLGLLGSSLAYLLYFTLLHKIGPTRMTMVTYIPPLIAVVLGVTFLEEKLTWQLAAGAALILLGITIVNQRFLFKKRQTKT